MIDEKNTTTTQTILGGYELYFEGPDDLLLNNVTIEIRSGEILGLGGESGSGKTLLLEILAGLTRPLLGEVVYEAKVIDSENGPLPDVGYIAQTSQLDERLRVWQWLEYCAALQNIPSDKVWSENPLEQFGIESKREALIEDLSPGEWRLIGLSSVFLRPRPAYVLDMPLALLGDKQRECVQQALDAATKRGAGIIVSDSSLRGLESWTKRVVSLAEGRLSGDA